ncbi:MAG TPA: MFS transporter, partial [Dehalococcoidia bacterium]|nr:MFS transporter [Dehalococcoidia bacterium]
AFSYSAYRRYWFASVCRVFGMTFRFIGAGWLVAVELDQSPLWLGLVALSSAIPTIILSIPAGAIADRVDSRRILLISQSCGLLAHLTIATLVVTDVVELWMVFIWAIAAGAFTAFDAPALQALLPRLIDMRVMASAVALNSSVWNGMRVIGPAIAGILIAVLGSTGPAFFFTAGGFALSVLLLASLTPGPVGRQSDAEHGGMWEGFRFIFARPLFFATIGLSFFTSVFGASYVILLPIFANETIDVGSQGFGFMEAASGVGALAATLFILKLGVGPRAGPTMLVAAAVFGVIIAGFAITESLPPAIALLFAAGIAEEIYLVVGMTTIQLHVPNELRGRVMGIWSMTWFLAAVGGFVAGAAAELLGVRLTIAAGALAVSGFAIVLLLSVSELRGLADVRRAAPTHGA